MLSTRPHEVTLRSASNNQLSNDLILKSVSHSSFVQNGSTLVIEVGISRNYLTLAGLQFDAVGVMSNLFS